MTHSLSLVTGMPMSLWASGSSLSTTMRLPACEEDISRNLDPSSVLVMKAMRF